MLYGWLEIGASNNALFASENNDDIILRTIYNNKIILGNTNGTQAQAAMYIKGNNVGVYKVPDSNVSLDVNGFTVLKTAQVGLSDLATRLTLNGDFIIKDKAVTFSNNMELSFVNSNASCDIYYNGVSRMQVTNGNGITLNDTVYVTKDCYATAFLLTSDIRFKDNIAPTDKPSDVHILKGIEVKNYDLIANREVPVKHNIKGFIAQQMETVFPNAVYERPTRGAPMKTIDVAQVTALNTSVLQTLLSRIEELEKYVYENK